MNLFSTLDDLTFVEELGSGYFGCVCLYIEKNTNKLYEFKMLDTRRAKNENY